MPTLSEMKIDLMGIGDILKANLLSVPKYQRSYAWEDKNVIDLFQDLRQAMHEDEDEYFLGSIVCIHTAINRLEVVDGQQRLATTIVLLAAIRDFFLEHGEEDRGKDIERDYLMKRERRTQDFIPNLHLNEADHDFFYKRILLPPGSTDRMVTPTKASHHRIDRAGTLASEFIQKLSTDAPNLIDVLNDWMDYIDSRAKVIWVRVRDDANAFTIFETLNDRGLALAITDLLKNFLFSKARDRLDEVQERWITMSSILEQLDEAEVSLNFVRHYWSSKHGVTRKNELYASIKSKTTSRQKALDLAQELSAGAYIYEGLINPDASVWGQYDQSSVEHMSTLNLLGMVQVRPLLLAVLSTFPPADVNKTMKHAVSWAVRFLIVGNLGGGVMERHYSNLAVQIRNGQIVDAKSLLDAMKKIVPSDLQFESAFKTAIVSKPNVARYYLRTLEMVASGNTNPAQMPNPNPQAVNLEHILPQNPSSQWQLDEETAKTYYNRLGNLALLESKANRQLRNRGFEEKVGSYKESRFKLTRLIADQSEWGVRQIEERQAKLAKLALEAWRT